MSRSADKTGLWMIGVAGGVGSTVALGIAALSRGLADATGLVTALPPFQAAALIDPGAIVVGGHEIRSQTLLDAVRHTHKMSGVFSVDLIDACRGILNRMQHNIRPGIVHGNTSKVRAMADRRCLRRVSTPAKAVDIVAEDLAEFRRRHRLGHVVVVNVASSEPPVITLAAHANPTLLTRALHRKGARALPPSSIYALGAIREGCSYINFTPSVGLNLPAIEEEARAAKVLFMGRDGKTGETLVKSVLAPMFAMRNLAVRSWVGHNILGNRDGEILSDPAVKAAKVRSKDRLLTGIFGNHLQTRTSIEHVASLGDWKVAWDFIHFEGFLGTKMDMQFVWTGSDSLLAAPLVIDLVRLTAHERRQGRWGRMKHLAYFFKDPDGVRDHHLVDQWRRLVEHVAPTWAGADA